MAGKAFLVFAFPSVTDHIVLTWAKFSSPTTYEGSLSYAPSHPERNETIITNSGEMYEFKFWQSVDGVTLGTRLLSMKIDTGVYMNKVVVYNYVVDRGAGEVDPTWNDPEHGDTTITDERLIGVEKIKLERRGIGPLREDEFSFDSGTGVISIAPSGEAFYAEDTWFATVQTSAALSSGSGGGPTPAPTPYGAYELLEVGGDLSFTAAHKNKILYWTSNAVMGTITLPSFDSISPCRFKVVNHGCGASCRYVKVQLDSSDTVMLHGVAKNRFWLGVGEEIEIEVKASLGYVTDYKGEYGRLGEVVWGRKGERNRLALDGTSYAKSAIERLYYDYINLLPVNQVKTMAQRAETSNYTTADNLITTAKRYRGFFGVDTLNVMIPDLTDMFIRSAGTDDRMDLQPGGYQHQDVIIHSHDVVTAGSGTPGATGKALVRRSDYNGDPYQVGASTLGPYIERVGGSSTRPDNICLIPQIII